MFEGLHQDGFQAGRGTLTFKSGDKLVGHFSRYSLLGYGVKVDSSGKVTQHGHFDNNTVDFRALAA